MEKAFEEVESLAATVKDYVANRLDAVQLDAAEKSAGIVSSLTARISVGLVVLLCFIFSGIGLAILIGESIQLLWAGYIIVSLFFLLAAFFIWQSRDRIFKYPVMNAMMKQLYDQDEENK